MSLLFFQLKQAYLSLKQKPGFVFSVVTTMGVTLGALLCVLTLAYVMLIKPLPYPEQDRLYSVEHEYINASGNKDALGFSYPNLINLYNNQSVFTDTALIAYFENVLMSLPHQPTTRTTFVTPEYFSMLNAPLVLGRKFESTEALDRHNPVALLSFATWVNEFNQDAEILSKKIIVRGVSFRIVGVLAESFIEPQIRSAGVKTAIWFPWDYNNDNRYKNNWTGIGVNLAFLGKLKNGLSITQAEESITHLVNETWQEHVVDINFFKGFNINLQANSLKQVILGNAQNTIVLLLVGALGLLIIAVSNIANLTISRSMEQRKNLAIHACLGVKKIAVFKKLFIETAILMSVSVVLALIIAYLGFGLLQFYLSSLLPRIDELVLNQVTFVSAGLSILAFSLLFSWLNNKFINYQTLNSELKSSGKGAGNQVSQKAQQVLIYCQVAVAATLVFTNIALFKNALDNINTQLGYQLENVHYLVLSITSSDRLDRKRHAALMADFRQQVANLPQVETVSKSSSPLDVFGISAITNVETNESFSMPLKPIDESYFSLIAQPLLEGDFFNADHIKNESMVVIINDVFANKIAKNTSAVGMKVELGSDGIATIIGVVKGVKLPGETNIPMRFYDTLPSDLRLLIKVKKNYLLTRQQLIHLLKEVSGKYAVFSYQNLNEVKQQKLFTQKATVLTTAVLAIITLLLTALGLYGILSYSTQMRRFEIGTRLAIGAKGSDVVKLILKDNASAIVIGIVTSVAILLALISIFSEQLQAYISWQLLPIFLITLGLISVISFTACYLPLRQYVNKPAIYSLRGSE